jgi:ribonuclease HI
VYACIAALAALPPSQAVHIHTDSQGLIVGYESFVTRAHLQAP